MGRRHISLCVLIPDELLDIQFRRWNLIPDSTSDFTKSHIDDFSHMAGRVEMSFNLLGGPDGFENLYEIC